MSLKKLVFLSCLLFSTMWASEQQSFYDYLDDVLLKSKPATTTSKRAVKVDPSAPLKAVRPEDLAVKTPSEIDQRLLFVQLLQNEHPEKTFGDVLDKTGIAALELVNRGEQYAAVSRKFGVTTVFAEPLLTSLLACPLADRCAVKQRQNVVRLLGENTAALNEIKHALLQIHEGQALLLSFFDGASGIDDRLLVRVYGPFGKSLPAIVTYKTLDRIGAVTGLLSPLAMGISFAENYKAMARFMADEPLTKAEKIAFLTTVTTGLSWNGIKRAPKTLLDWHNPVEMLRGAGPSLRSKAGHLAFGCARVLAYDALIAWMYYTRIQENKVANAIYDNMQTRLIGVGQVIRGMQRINAVLQKDPVLMAAPECAGLAALFGNQNSSGLKTLLGLLQTRTFEGKASYFSNGIRILRAYKLMCEHKHELVPALEAVGVLDNFAAAAQLVAHGPKGAYCYVTLADSQKPVIDLKGFWNPLMNFESAVTNNVKLGASGDANMMLTGPNGSGKSTNMKAIALNVLLAQTFGIAAAQSATVTPFDKIYTYINVQENIQEGMSTFMAEAQRLDRIDNAITNALPGKRYLTIVDEGLKGTVAAEAITRLCVVCQRICKSPQSVCVFATHFEEPTRLQKETDGRWVNYYVNIAEPTPGDFVRLYSLERGTNAWWFTDEQKRKRFVDWLVRVSAKGLTGG